MHTKQLYTIFKSPGANPPQPRWQRNILQKQAVPKSPGADLTQAFRQYHPVNGFFSRKGFFPDHRDPFRNHHTRLFTQILQKHCMADAEISQHLPIYLSHHFRHGLCPQSVNPCKGIFRTVPRPDCLQGRTVLEGIPVNLHICPFENDPFQIYTVPECPASDFP